MNLEILQIKDIGDIENERIIYRVNEAINLGRYIVAESYKIEPRLISSSIKNIYWLPDQDLDKGDLVILYRKKGDSESLKNQDGSTSYFYYWGQDTCLPDNSAVVLLEANWMFRFLSDYTEK